MNTHQKNTRPWKVHKIVVGVICLGPLLGGGRLFIEAASSHSDLSPMGMISGGLLVIGAGLYAMVSSLLIRMLPPLSPRRVVLLHLCLLAVVGLVIALWK